MSEMDQNQIKSINSRLSMQIDEIATFANMLDEKTHDEANCGEGLDELMKVLERIDQNVQATKRDYRQLSDLMKKRSK